MALPPPGGNTQLPVGPAFPQQEVEYGAIHRDATHTTVNVTVTWNGEPYTVIWRKAGNISNNDARAAIESKLSQLYILNVRYIKNDTDAVVWDGASQVKRQFREGNQDRETVKNLGHQWSFYNAATDDASVQATAQQITNLRGQIDTAGSQQPPLTNDQVNQLKTTLKDAEERFNKKNANLNRKKTADALYRQFIGQNPRHVQPPPVHQQPHQADQEDFTLTRSHLQQPPLPNRNLKPPGYRPAPLQQGYVAPTGPVDNSRPPASTARRESGELDLEDEYLEELRDASLEEQEDQAANVGTPPASSERRDPAKEMEELGTLFGELGTPPESPSQQEPGAHPLPPPQRQPRAGPVFSGNEELLPGSPQRNKLPVVEPAQQRQEPAAGPPPPMPPRPQYQPRENTPPPQTPLSGPPAPPPREEP